MAITTMTAVKTIARIANLFGTTAPATSTAGALGDIYLNTTSGLTYELTAFVLTPTPNYTWTADASLDAEITLQIARAEVDYLRIRGIAFEMTTDTVPAIIYPSGASTTAAEMVCFLMGIGRIAGRGKAIESLGGRSSNYEQKIFGYPLTIISTIERFQSAI